MSKNFPGSPRKYDFYMASPESVQIGRVLFVNGKRMVIREAMTREQWTAERALSPDSEGPRILGVGTCGDKPREGAMPMGTGGGDEVPADFTFFYGGDYF